MVTGANSGVGREVARNLHLAGATVILACRDPGRAEAARADLASGGYAERLEVLLVDLSDQVSIRSAARTFLDTGRALDVLVNNAAICLPSATFTPQGIETTWATNVLAYLLFTEQLLPALRAAGSSRIVDVASTLAGDLDLSDLNMKRRGFSTLVAYKQSKQANRMLAWERARQLAGTGITCNAVHPGGVRSGIVRHLTGLSGWVTRLGNLVLGGSPATGARTPTWVAMAPELREVTGAFFENEAQRPCEFREEPRRAELWAITREQAGLC